MNGRRVFIGRNLCVPALLSLLTGMRRNEVLALRWGRVDLGRNIIKVQESLEFTKAHGIRFKPPKSKAGRRDITLPDFPVETLREHRKAQLELRLKLGAGKLQDDDLLLPTLAVRRFLPMRSAQPGAITPRESACRK